MRAIATVENPDGVEVTIAVTMRVSEWRKLTASLSQDEWPEWQYRAAVLNAISRRLDAITVTSEDNAQ